MLQFQPSILLLATADSRRAVIPLLRERLEGAGYNQCTDQASALSDKAQFDLVLVLGSDIAIAQAKVCQGGFLVHLGCTQRHSGALILPRPH